MALYEFGSFVLDTPERRLTRQGARVAVSGKTLDVLRLLVEAEGRLVDRQTFNAQLWPEVVVEDRNLTVHISALRKALGAKLGINRYGFLLPMDEARTQVAIDLSGRAYAVFEGRFGREEVGGLATELVPHFFRSLADSLGAAVHVSVTGENSHHMIEACFKGTGRALRQAFRREGRELPSTKGVL